jgi:Zn-dependent M28 family amino/carboxypeptidase
MRRNTYEQRLIIVILLMAMTLSACTAGNTSLATPTLTQVISTATTAALPSATPIPTATAVPVTAQAATPLPEFNGDRAYEDVLYQDSLGPRTPGSEAHDQAVKWMQETLEEAGWSVELQETTYAGQPVRNVIAKRGSGKPLTILGAHYDTRLVADRDTDPAKQSQPVPGANDGASGVAVLLELARVLPADLPGQVWLAFFDSEDQGQLPGWDWIFGSRAFAQSLTVMPDAVVIVDMIGDANLNIPHEQNSNAELLRQIWEVAARRGHDNSFLNRPGYSMLDDHTPFLELGIPAVDIIDFDYPYYHTTGDTPDKVSAQSLYAVGDTLLYWLIEK